MVTSFKVTLSNLIFSCAVVTVSHCVGVRGVVQLQAQRNSEQCLNEPSWTDFYTSFNPLNSGGTTSSLQASPGIHNYNEDMPSPTRMLKITQTGSHLPEPLISASAVYDGHDSIYVIGGYDVSNRSDRVIKYTLESEESQPSAGRVTELQKFIAINGGCAIMPPGSDTILYFGGYSDDSREHSDKVYSYSTRHQNYSLVARLPMTLLQHLAVVWDPTDQVAYIFGASMAEEPDSQVIGRYDPADHKIEIVATVREPASDPFAVWYGSSGRVGREDSWGSALIIGSAGHGQSKVMKYEWQAGKAGANSHAPQWHISTLVERLPYSLWLPCAIYAENIDQNVYVFGSVARTEGFIRFHPVTFESDVVPVEGWPALLTFVACVYVPKLGRIYNLGGWSSGGPGNFGNYGDNISYVQLHRDSAIDSGSGSKSISTRGDAGEFRREADGGLYFMGYGYTLLLFARLAYFSLHCLRLAYRTSIAIAIAVAIAISNKKTQRQPKLGGRTGLPLHEIQMFHKGAPKLTYELFACRDNINCQPYNSEELELADEAVFINWEEVIGTGEFGIVLRGTISGSPGDSGTGHRVSVAVKTIKPGSTKKVYVRALLTEIKILAHIGRHDHIVNLLGAQTARLDQGDVKLFTEYCPLGDLESYLRGRRDAFQDECDGSNCCAYVRAASSYVTCKQVDPTGSTDLFRWSTQIADAMTYLESKKVIHADLAARNVLLLSKTCAKITDFGLAKKLYNYINYTRKNEVPLPWRSMAIESLTEMSFSAQSDVWSFGVTLWEIFSLGQVPYHAATQCCVEFVTRLQKGSRLPKPRYATRGLYELMLRCWSLKPSERPAFIELKTVLEQMEKEQKGCCPRLLTRGNKCMGQRF